MSEIEWVHPEPSAPRDLPPRGRRGRLATAGGLAAALALGVVAFVAFHHSRGAVTVSFNGKHVDSPQTTITQADATFARFAAARHGRVLPTSRCYFQRPDSAADDAVDPALACGPVLFYDGAAPNDYVAFPLTSTPASRAGHVTLASAAVPSTPAPGAVPSGTALLRPDRKQPDPHAAITAPIPPPAAPDTVLALAGQDLPSIPAIARTNFVGTRDVTVALSASGPVSHYGQGNDERSAPAGQRLLGFELIISPGELDLTPYTELDLGVSSDNGPVHRIPFTQQVTGSGQYFVAAVPQAATSIDLVVVDSGITQRMSLLTGAPGPDNLAVLERTDRIDGIDAHGQAVATVDSNARFTAHLDVSLQSATLDYYTPYSLHASGPSRALVYVDICYSSKEFVEPDECHTFRGPDLRLTPKGGKAIIGRDASTTDSGYIVFDVPATFTAGTLEVIGRESGDGFSMDVTTPCTFAILFGP